MLLLFGQAIFDLRYAIDLHASTRPFIHERQHAGIRFELDCVELLSGVDAQFLGA
jgi:hypothetical protein